MHANSVALGIGRSVVRGQEELSIALMVSSSDIEVDYEETSAFPASYQTPIGVTTCYVPIKIETYYKGGRENSLINVAAGIAATGHNAGVSRSLYGAVCSIVSERGNPSKRYLLGCTHVFGLTKNVHACVAASQSIITNRIQDTKIGQLIEASPLLINGAPCIDAAICSILPGAAVTWDYGPTQPRRVQRRYSTPRNCRIYTPRGAITAIFSKEWTNIPLNYSCGTVVLKAAYQFIAETMPGDSGSAVISDDGTLYGMHIWGDIENRVSLAIPGWALFEDGLFSINIQL